MSSLLASLAAPDGGETVSHRVEEVDDMVVIAPEGDGSGDHVRTITLRGEWLLSEQGKDDNTRVKEVPKGGKDFIWLCQQDPRLYSWVTVYKDYGLATMVQRIRERKGKEKEKWHGRASSASSTVRFFGRGSDEGILGGVH